MRKFVIFFILLISAGLGYYYFSIDSGTNFSISSPLPKLLTRSFPNIQNKSNVWKPNGQILGSTTSIKVPEITASAAGIYDLTLHKYIYKKNTEKHLPIASLTKLMTAIVALENMDLNKDIKIGKKAAKIGEDSMGLTEGEILPLHELMYGLLLPSGNDAGEAIAASSKFGRANFVYLMNKKAEELGLSDTHYTNPTGLQGDGKQYSNVDDLIVVTRYALEKPEFASIVSTYEHDIEQTGKHKAYTLYNETNLLTTYPGVKGVKTGYTDEAGMCLVTYLDYHGHKIIGVVLNAENRREEMKSLLDYSLKTLGIEPPVHE